MQWLTVIKVPASLPVCRPAILATGPPSHGGGPKHEDDPCERRLKKHHHKKHHHKKHHHCH